MIYKLWLTICILDASTRNAVKGYLLLSPGERNYLEGKEKHIELISQIPW